MFLFVFFNFMAFQVCHSADLVSFAIFPSIRCHLQVLGFSEAIVLVFPLLVRVFFLESGTHRYRHVNNKCIQPNDTSEKSKGKKKTVRI